MDIFWNNTIEIRASNYEMSSMPTGHCALFKMVAVGISKRLEGSSLKINKQITSHSKAFVNIGSIN